jgi:hypothetical protein
VEVVVRRTLAALSFIVLAAIGSACSSESSAPPATSKPSGSGAGFFGGAAPAADNAVDTNAYCQAAQQLVQLDAKAKSGTSIEPKDLQGILSQINASAPANIKTAYGQLFFNPSSNPGNAQQVIGDYNKATCNITTP